MPRFSPTRLALGAPLTLFLLAGVSVHAPALQAQPQRPAAPRDTVRVAVVIPAVPGPSALQVFRGVTMSVEESGRVAALLGHVVTLDTVRPEDPLPPGIRFIIEAVAPRDPATHAIRLDAGCATEPRAPNVFSLCDDDAGAAGADSVVAWDASLEKYGGSQLNARFLARWGNAMDDAAWRGWLAAKIAWESALRGPRDPAALARWLASAAARFDGHQGVPLSFGPDHHLRHPRYRVVRRGSARVLETIP